MDKSTTFQYPTGRRYKGRQKRERNEEGETEEGDREYQPRKFQGRTSNRRMISILLRRYEQMARRRFGEDVDQKVDLKQLLLDCFHYDLNLLLELNVPYTHLDELVQSEPTREERNKERDNEEVVENVALAEVTLTEE